MPTRIAVSPDALARVCEAHGIRELSFFGSVLRDDFQVDSDVDVLVEFRPGCVPSLFGMTDLEGELTRLLGRRVDLVTRAGLSRYVADQVLASREVQYVSP